MDWIINLFTNTESVAHIALLYAIVIAIGVYLGKIKIGGISLGVTFVLFAGILAGHVGFNESVMMITDAIGWKLDKAVEEVIKQGNYDLVLERGAVVDVKPQYEITRQVIERMNSQR